MTKKSQLPAYAIVRVDTFQPSSVSPRNRVTVTRIVWDQELAELEVARLNALGVTDCEYFWQHTLADVMPDTQLADSSLNWVVIHGGRIEKSFLDENVAEARRYAWTKAQWSQTAGHGHCLICWVTLSGTDDCFESQGKWLCGYCFNTFVAPGVPGGH